MKLVITITADNDAFEGDELGPETARILHDLAIRVSRLDRNTLWRTTPLTIRDVNGNTAGQLAIEDD